MAILDAHTLDFISHSPAQTQRLGARLGALLEAGDVVCLEGELGSGKTCLVQGIGQGMGIEEPITSPSFILIAEHRPAKGPTLYHIDLYRLETPVAEAWEIGAGDYLGGEGVCVIEWADRLGEALPAERLWITLRFVDEAKRGVTMVAAGPRYDELLRRFREDAFGM